MPDIVINKFLNLHRTAIPIDHPDRSVTRVKLEYPKEDVYLMYLVCIDKGIEESLRSYRTLFSAWLTSESFTDKAITEYMSSVKTTSNLIGRYIDTSNFYCVEYYAPEAPEAHKIIKYYLEVEFELAVENVDIHGVYKFKFAISGSTLTSYRNTSSISATDTDITSGKWGFCPTGMGEAISCTHSLLARLVSPSSELVKPITIIECEILGMGKKDDPIRPNLVNELVEISSLSNISRELYLEAKKYYTLKNKGYSDEEIKALLGYIPQHQVDLGAVSWGVFDHKKDHSTMLIIVTKDNPFKEAAIEKQKEFAKSRGLRVLSPPKDYNEAINQYKQLKKDYPMWLAGKDDYAYRTLGYHEIGLLANVDFYYGELIEHRTHYNQIKQVRDEEIRNRLLQLQKELEKTTVLIEERNKHINKIKTIFKLGW